MPTYDYECDACGKRFELFQSIHNRPVKKCPHCGKSKARRLMGAGGGLIFKGSGFYITDYKRSSKPDAAPPKDAPPTPSAKSSKPPEKKGKPNPS